MMVDTDVKNALSDIETYTLKTVAPFIATSFSGGMKYGYKEFEGPDRYTTYLMFVHEDRVLFYGVDSPKRRYLIPMLSEEVADGEEAEELIAALFAPCLFAKKGALTDVEFADMVHSDNDNEIEDLESVSPEKDETDKDFFFRNAMWLLNPMVH